jgi:hypothetical protein
MDKHTFATIAISVAVTIIVTATLRGAFGFLNAIIPITETNEKLKKTFATKSIRAIFWDTVWLIWILGMMVLFYRDRSSITRGTILIGSGLTVSTVLILGMLFYRIGYHRAKREFDKARERLRQGD